jgi:hypothetical protein
VTAPPTDPTRKWVGLLCEELAFLRDLPAARDPATAGRLTALVEAAAAGRADRAWVADLLDLLRRLGFPGGYPERGGPLDDHTVGGLPPLGGGSPSLDRYRCPQGICGRAQVRRPGGPVPWCAVFAVELPVAEVPR